MLTIRGRDMHIGEAAKCAGVSMDAIRFYERSGILIQAPRSGGGYRLYTSTDLETIHFVRRMKELGFSLPQIRELIQLRTSQRRACAPVRDRLSRKLADIRAKAREIKHLERELQAALRKCDREIRKHSQRCPLLDNSGDKTSRKPQ